VNVQRRQWDRAAFAEKAKERAEREAAGAPGDASDEEHVLHPARSALLAEADDRAAAAAVRAAAAARAAAALAAGEVVPEASRPAAVGAAGPEGSARAFLPQRDAEALQLEARLNKRRLVTEATPKSQSGGYWCDVCECSLRDSQVYLDHINGRPHQRKLGFSMRVEKSSVSAVQARIAGARAAEEAGRRREGDEEGRRAALEELDARVEAADEREAEERARKRAKRAADKAAAAAAAAAAECAGAGAAAGSGPRTSAAGAPVEGADAASEAAAAEAEAEAAGLAAMLGFGAFGGKR